MGCIPKLYRKMALILPCIPKLYRILHVASHIILDSVLQRPSLGGAQSFRLAYA